MGRKLWTRRSSYTFLLSMFQAMWISPKLFTDKANLMAWPMGFSPEPPPRPSSFAEPSPALEIEWPWTICGPLRCLTAAAFSNKNNQLILGVLKCMVKNCDQWQMIFIVKNDQQKSLVPIWEKYMASWETIRFWWPAGQTKNCGLRRHCELLSSRVPSWDAPLFALPSH